MAASYKKAKITYDGDGTLKGIAGNGDPDIIIDDIIIDENGEWFVRVEEYTAGTYVIYAPETDNYAAAVLEFTTSG